MADETLRFDIVGNDKASDAFSRAGRSASEMSGKMDAAAVKAGMLDEALKRQRATAKASADATLSLAKSDAILAEVEGRLRDGALEAEFALKKEAEAKRKSADASRRASAENAGFAASLGKVANSMKAGGGPAWLGPALALAPLLTSLGGVAAGAAIGLGGAAVAGGGALAAFGAVAKPVLADALKAEQAVQKAQDAYNIAIANGTKKAVAYKAEQVAIAKAYADLSPAQITLSKQLGAMSQAWDNVKAAETPVVAGALQPWLKSVTDLTGKLGPIIGKVSPVIRDLGTQFDHLVNSSAFTGFRNFVASTGSKVVGAAGGTLIDFLKAGLILLPQFDPLILKMTKGLGDLGPALVKWASSKKTADDITKFMAWFSQNGPAVGNLLKNIGGALKAFAPGLGPAATAEINVFSQFFGFIAKLPPALAKPLVEVAGVMLTLNKLGVVSVGVKFLGLLSGSGGAAAGAAAGAEGAAAGGILSKLLPGIRIVGGIGIITLGIRLAGSLVPKDMNKQVAADLKKQPPAAVKVTDFLHLTNLAGWIDANFSHPIRGWLENSLPQFFIKAGRNVEHIWDVTGHDILHIWDMTWNNTITRTAKGFHDVAGWFDRGRHDTAAKLDGIRADTAHYWDITWNNTVARAGRGVRDVAGWFDTMRHGTAGKFDGIRHDIAADWDTIWNNTVSRVSRGVRDVTTWFGTLPGKATAALHALGGDLLNIGSWAIGQLWAGLKSAAGGIGGGGVIGWIEGFAKGIVSTFKKIWGWFSPSSVMYEGGKSLMQGLANGIRDHAHLAMKQASGVANRVANVGGGVQRWAGTVLQALRMEGLPSGYLGDVLYQMQTESGGNPNAINLWDSNAAAGDPSRGLMQTIMGTFQAYHWPGTSWNIYDPLANIAAALNYAAHNRGFGTGPGQIGSGHGYAYGTLSAAPGWAWVGERGPELMHFRGGEQVYPAHAAGGTQTIIIQVDPAVAAVTPDRQLGKHIAGHVTKYIGGGGRIYPPGVAPR